MLAALVVAVIGFWVLGAVSTALTPTLIRDHPLALVVLEPRNRNLLLTASKVDWLPFVLWSIPRRVASDPVYFALGWFYGDRALAWFARRSSGRGRRLLARLQRVFPTLGGVLVFLVPGLLVCLLAGVVRMAPRTFLAINLAGTVAAVVVLRAFADQLEPVLEPVIAWNDRNATRLTVATVGFVGAYLVWHRWRGTSELGSLRDLREDRRDN